MYGCYRWLEFLILDSITSLRERDRFCFSVIWESSFLNVFCSISWEYHFKTRQIWLNVVYFCSSSEIVIISFSLLFSCCQFLNMSQTQKKLIKIFQGVPHLNMVKQLIKINTFFSFFLIILSLIHRLSFLFEWKKSTHGDLFWIQRNSNGLPAI